MEAQNKYNFKNITETIIYIILCHCLGDYFFQTEYLAINKGSDNYILFVHCVTYCTPFIIKFGLSWKIYFIFIVHFFTDLSKAKYDLISITTDQIIHYIAALVFIIKNWENNGIFNRTIDINNVASCDVNNVVETIENAFVEDVLKKKS